MAKPVDPNHDSTQELSASQLVVPPAPPKRSSHNDASMWQRNIVSGDDFAPTHPMAPRGRNWLGILVIGVLVIGAGAGAYFWLQRDVTTSQPASGPTPPP